MPSYIFIYLNGRPQEKTAEKIGQKSRFEQFKFIFLHHFIAHSISFTFVLSTVTGLKKSKTNRCSNSLAEYKYHLSLFSCLSCPWFPWPHIQCFVWWHVQGWTEVILQSYFKNNAKMDTGCFQEKKRLSVMLACLVLLSLSNQRNFSLWWQRPQL